MGLRKIVSLAAAVVVIAPFAGAQTIQINRDNKTIAISTTDEATAVADIAAITIGFQIYDSDSESAYAQAGNLSKAVMDALHNAGVDDKSIESNNQNLSRNNNFDEKDSSAQRAKKQFAFEQSWTVTAAPQNAGALIRLAIAAGANQSGQIEWRLADHKGLQAQAAASALIKARAVASQMADGLHVKLGALIYASNDTPNAKLYIPRALDGRDRNAMAGLVGSSVLAAPALEIRPQTMREEATVYAVFTIE